MCQSAHRPVSRWHNPEIPSAHQRFEIRCSGKSSRSREAAQILTLGDYLKEQNLGALLFFPQMGLLDCVYLMADTFCARSSHGFVFSQVHKMQVRLPPGRRDWAGLGDLDEEKLWVVSGL